MFWINSIGFIAFGIGIYFLFPQHPLKLLLNARDGANKIFSKTKKKRPLAKRIRKNRKVKEKKGMFFLIQEARHILKLTGKENILSYLSLVSIFLIVVGIMIGIFTDNFYLIPVLAVLFGMIPYFLVLLFSVKLQKELNGELETVLSIITTSYLRKEDIVKAVEENIEYINPQIRVVFQQFLLEADLLTSSLKSSLENLKYKIHNEIWREWVTALISCQDNKELKTTLPPIVAKLSNERILTEELSTLLYAPLKEWATMLFLYILNYALLINVMPQWFQPMLESQVGKAAIAVSIAIVVGCVPGIVALTRPITYRDK